VVEADNYAKQIKAEIKSEGDMALAIKGKQRIDALRLLDAFSTKKSQDDAVSAVRLLTVHVKDYAPSKPLMAEAVRFWLSHHPQGGTLPTLTEALAAYLEDKRLEKRRAATLYEISHKIGRFIKAFPETSISDITTELISQWLTDTLESSTVGTKRQYLTVISAFFTDSAKRYGLPKNPAKDVKIAGSNADQTEVQAYTVDEVRKIMKAANASSYAVRVVPAMAIGFFAGLRPSEVQGLDWVDVSLTAKRIRVSPETAKKRRARYVDMSDNLIEWLTPYAQERGLVAPPLMTYRRARTEIMASAGCSLIKDGFRHSFGTYHLASHENAAKTAFAMGHRSDTDLVYTNYRKLVTKEEGEAYWKIRPVKLLESTVTGKMDEHK
jgi:integrase